MNSEHPVERRKSIIGGIVGALMGLMLLSVSIDTLGGFLGNKNPFILLLLLVWAVFNCFGVVGLPLLGFLIGYHCTVTVTYRD